MPQTVFIIQDEHLAKTLSVSNLVEIDGDDSFIPVQQIEIFSLPHLRYVEKLAKYVYINGTILEVQTIEHEDKDNFPGCWFISDSIESNGALYLCTKVDISFLLLPYLYDKFVKKSVSTFCDMSQILSSSESNTKYISQVVQTFSEEALNAKLGLICDISSVGSVTAYRLNNDKLLKWLRTKVARLASTLSFSQGLRPVGMVANPNISDGSDVASGLSPSHFDVTQSWHPQATYLLTSATAFVGEYINEQLYETLLATYIDDEGLVFSLENLKKQKRSDLITGDKEVVNEEQTKRKLAATVEPKKKGKAAVADPKGSKLITSFFKKV